MIRFILIALGIALIVFLYRIGFFSTALFKIRVRGSGIYLSGEIPGRSRPQVLDFLKSLNLRPGATITGYRDTTRFRLAFSRDISEGNRQRIRNFLYL